MAHRKPASPGPTKHSGLKTTSGISLSRENWVCANVPVITPNSKRKEEENSAASWNESLRHIFVLILFFMAFHHLLPLFYSPKKYGLGCLAVLSRDWPADLCKKVCSGWSACNVLVVLNSVPPDQVSRLRWSFLIAIRIWKYPWNMRIPLWTPEAARGGSLLNLKCFFSSLSVFLFSYSFCFNGPSFVLP